MHCIYVGLDKKGSVAPRPFRKGHSRQMLLLKTSSKIMHSSVPGRTGRGAVAAVEKREAVKLLFFSKRRLW